MGNAGCRDWLAVRQPASCVRDLLNGIPIPAYFTRSAMVTVQPCGSTKANSRMP